MKRLLRISFDLSLLSFIPIILWFLLGIIVDKNLINIFTLTYPLQFIWALMKSIFATGANISKEKDKNENAVLSGMTLGIIVGWIIGILLHSYILNVVPPDQVMFNPTIWIGSYIIPFIVITAVTFILKYYVNNKLKNVDMLEALKSVD